MRLLIATPWTGFWEVGAGGGVPDEYLTFRELIRRGHELHLVAPAGADYALPESAPGQLTLHSVPYPANRWRGRLRGQLGRLRDLWLARRAYGAGLRAIAARVEPQLILAHTFHTFPWAARIAARREIPVVGKFFGVLELNQSWQPGWLHFARHFEQYLAFRSPGTRFIVLNDGTGGDRAALRLGVPPERLLFWPNGVDVDWAEEIDETADDRRPGRARFALPDDRCLALTLCNLLPLKKVERLLEALVHLPEVTGVVAGDGEMRGALEALATRLGIAERVIFLGAVDHAEVPALLRAIDIYVAPHDLTNAGLPTCEAMLCGRPVVALDIGDTGEVVVDGETGLLVPPPTGTAGMATAMRRLAHDPDLRRQLGERGRELARQRFVSWEERVAMEVALLESLVSDSA